MHQPMHQPATLRFNGTLKKWNEERGFGFVIADLSDHELFVHVSAFPRNGRQPMVGEALSFEVELDRDGRKRAVRVRRPGDRAAQSRSVSGRRPEPRRTDSAGWSFGSAVVALLMVAGLGWHVYGLYSQSGRVASQAATPHTAMDAAAWTAARSAQPSYRCDGRQHCSQMTSCEEAKFFLKNCPDPKMDGDGDGVPCEQQLCTGAFGGGGLF
jgi:cold shock CspA family protein